MPTLTQYQTIISQLGLKFDTPRNAWQQLAELIKQVNEHNIQFAFWLRDDDTIHPTKQLERLFDICQTTPIALAVIPAETVEELAQFLDHYDPLDRHHPRIQIAQHGWSHTNHAIAKQKKIEITLNRNLSIVKDELLEGFQKLEQLFKPRYTKGLVPPWNRIDMAILDQWRDHPYQWISCFQPNILNNHNTIAKQHPASLSLARFDAHIDPIDWKNNRQYIGDEAVLGQFLNALVATINHKSSNLNYQYPKHIPAQTISIGILTHHLVQNSDCDYCIQKLLQLVDDHNHCYWAFPWEV